MADPTPRPTPSTSTMSAPTPDPYAGGFKGNTSGVTNPAMMDPARDIYNSNDAQRKQLAILLKNAGYNVPTTGKQSTSVALADAYIQAMQQNATENARLGTTKSVSDWLKANVKETTTGGTSRYQPYGQQVIYDPTRAASFITEQFKELLNREPTAAEIKTWTNKLNKAQTSAAAATKVVYKTVNGVRTAVQTGGLDEAQWLKDQLAADKKLGPEYSKIKIQAPDVTQLAKDKKVYDDLVKAAKGDIGKINEAKQNTAYGRTLAEYTAEVNDKIIKSGATNDPAKAADIAKYLLDRGLSLDSESAQSYIDAQLQFGKGKTTVGTKTVEGFTGEAGSNVDALNKVALANGLTLDQVFDDAALSDVLSAVNAGEDINTYARIIRDAAKIAWNVPDNVAKLMDQGVSLDSIYGTYKRAYADTLELDPNTVTLKDLASMGVIGQPSKDSQAPQNLYDFTKALRKDDRWQYTQQANQEVAAATQKILQDFGFMG